ncbi:contact-dependent growth inhibition system immunity protein [Actinocrispum wychmicini]|uniref:Uncharacterized protein n=1 Tax=Actinocrispum wychmicini TaxID=1213861 RepID=A0A4R2K9B5_9PSEU|nr:contact-dependent growth inhibition system immunity protein [Actinocrispum wychmicini]TCO62995.1 hypothetical protein EV192_1021139 [Actinocrispum wychmicini]
MPDSQVQNDDLSVEQIEDNVWGSPPPGATKLMETVHQLRRKPVRTLEPEDLRVMISQQVGLEILVPRALAELDEDPLLEGDYHPGDVLVAVLKVPPTYWSTNPSQRATLNRIIDTVTDPDADLRADIDAFRQANPA